MITKKQQIAAITKAIVTAPSTTKPPPKPVKLAQSKSNIDIRTDRILQRNSVIVRGFVRKGIKVTFDKATGRFNNIKPYKTWLSEGRVVIKGRYSVLGFFHISQTQELPAPVVTSIANPVIGQQIPA